MTDGDIPFRKEMTFEYGVAQSISPQVRRIVAHNPSPFTFHGTNTYIVGHGRVAVIDPGPADESHIERIVAALEGEEVGQIIVTHTHLDHSPGAKMLRERIDAPVVGARTKPLPSGERTIEAAEVDFEPEIELADGDTFEGDGWTLTAVFTPGHMSNHHCLALEEEHVLFSGDHVMGWNTTIVSPPDGDMTDYFDSLRLCIERDDARYMPGHGPGIDRPKSFVRAYLGHRLMREGEILRCLESGLETVPAMVQRMYQHLPERMHWAAGRSVFAHLVHMVATGRVACEGEPSAESVFRLA